MDKGLYTDSSQHSDNLPDDCKVRRWMTNDSTAAINGLWLDQLVNQRRPTLAVICLPSQFNCNLTNYQLINYKNIETNANTARNIGAAAKKNKSAI